MTPSRVALLALLCLGVGPRADAGDVPVKVQLMTYAKLADFLYENRGKVVVVDLWNVGCPPCIQAMPHLVELHEKYAKKGLVVVSLNVDDPKDEEVVVDVKKTLTRKKLGPINNIMLDEGRDFWQKKFNIAGVPCIFIFDRDGKWHKYYEQSLQNEDRSVNVGMIESVVKHLLEQTVKGVK